MNHTGKTMTAPEQEIAPGLLDRGPAEIVDAGDELADALQDVERAEAERGEQHARRRGTGSPA